MNFASLFKLNILTQFWGYCDKIVGAALYANIAVQDIQIKNEIAQLTFVT